LTAAPACTEGNSFPASERFGDGTQHGEVLGTAEQKLPRGLASIDLALEAAEQLGCVFHLVEEERSGLLLQKEVRVGARPAEVNGGIESEDLQDLGWRPRRSPPLATSR